MRQLGVWRKAEDSGGRGLVLIREQVLGVAALGGAVGGSGCERAVVLRLPLSLVPIGGVELKGGCRGAEADSPALIGTSGRGATGAGLSPMRLAGGAVAGGGETVVVFLLVLCFCFGWPTATGRSGGPSL